MKYDSWEIYLSNKLEDILTPFVGIPSTYSTLQTLQSLLDKLYEDFTRSTDEPAYRLAIENNGCGNLTIIKV